MRRERRAQVDLPRKVLQHAVLATVGKRTQLVGIALGIALGDRRARAVDVEVVEQHDTRAGLEPRVQ